MAQRLAENPKQPAEKQEPHYSLVRTQIETQVTDFIGVSPKFAISGLDAKNQPLRIAISIFGPSGDHVDLADGYKEWDGLNIELKKGGFGKASELIFHWKDGTTETIRKNPDGTFEYDTTAGKGFFKVEKKSIVLISKEKKE